MVMTSNLHSIPPLSAAIAEMTDLIRESYPDAKFVVDVQGNYENLYIIAVVDVDDPDEVIDCFINRVLTMQVNEGLPLHVIPVHALARCEHLRTATQV